MRDRLEKGEFIFECFSSALEEDGRRVTAGECNQLVMDCTEILSAVCDLIHSRCAKILTIRAKASPKYSSITHLLSRTPARNA